MFARKGLGDIRLERHIYSFLVEGNLDLIYLNNEVSDPNRSIFDARMSSSLSIIRKISKGSKEATQIWQDKFVELKRYFSANPDFKTFYFRTVSPNEMSFREQFVAKDLMLSLFERMSSAPTQPLITMLKSAFEECDSWENCPDQLPESKDVIQNGKFELRKFYVSLDQLRQYQLPSPYERIVPSLSELQKQFKFLLFERIAYLLFKTDINKDIKKTNQVIETKTELPAYAARANDDCLAIKCMLFGIVLPSIIASALVGTLVPEGPYKRAIVGISISFAVLCTCFSFAVSMARRDNLHRNDLSQRFSTGFLDRLDRRYVALNQVSESKELAAASDVQNGEVKIDISSLIREHRLDIKPSELHESLLPASKPGGR